MLTLNDGRSELWQWDTGRTLTVDDDCSQVHFSNKVFGRSIDVDVADGVAIIPDILLQTDKELNVWAFVGTAENGYTKISKTFKVNRRNKPADYVFTPQEQILLKDAIAMVETAKSAANDAIESAKQAEASADKVEKIAYEIESTADQVEQNAKNATKAKEEAAAFAYDAETSETAAEGFRDAAELSAQSAYTSEQAAQSSAAQADQSAGAAAASEQAAAQAAETAQQVTGILKTDIDQIKSDLGDKPNAFINVDFSIENKRVSSIGQIVGSTSQYMTDYYTCTEGVQVKWHGKSFIHQGSSAMCLIAFFDANKTFISGVTSISGETVSSVGDVSAIAPANTAYVVGSTNGLLDGYYMHVFDINLEKIAEESSIAYGQSQISQQLIQSPALSNGSGGNKGNTNAVTARAVKFFGADYIVIKNNRAVSAAGNYYKYDISAFKGSTWYTNKISNILANDNEEFMFDCSVVINDNSEVDGFGVTIWEYNSSDVLQKIRIWDFENGDLIVRRAYSENIQTNREIKNKDIKHELLNARHQKGNPNTSLTLLHFSDIHGDSNALKRILNDAKLYDDIINDKICTGDIVGNTAGEIVSWWDKSVMTCIGNHDSASYSGGAYDWTSLSMADRDAYYIAPFENNWGIVHTVGTSYYYKDYTNQKVRLIVMDAMLYTNAGSEATAQTEWLVGLLADAITKELHVLIAIHAPHGGATAKECSFSRYAQGAMPTYTDCNTSQTVIDTVAIAIEKGLHFVGYIVGHMHQDNIWDAENDGKQLMYCVTCATTVTAQWKNSDLDRADNTDAYNLVTIDTANTLVKIIRGGGADIDDHMRTRKAICFNYSTGEKVGEIL